MSDPALLRSDAAASPSPNVALRAAFRRVPGYVDAATMGLPSIAGSAALHAALGEWAEGTASASGYDAAVSASRAAWAIGALSR